MVETPCIVEPAAKLIENLYARDVCVNCNAVASYGAISTWLLNLIQNYDA